MANQVPAFLLNLPTQGIVDKTLSHLGGMSPPYVSIMGGRFSVVDASGASEPVGEHDKDIGVYLDAVIVDSLENESKIYYAKPFDPNAQAYAPPDCWSDNGVGPSRQASNPQGGERRLCAPDPTGRNGCPLAVWGSATSRVSNKPVPACGKYQKVALVLQYDEVGVDGKPTGRKLLDDIVYLLRVPPNSLSNLQAYLAKFKGQTLGQGGPPLGPEHVVTRIWFEKDVLGTLMFRAIGYIDQPIAEFQKKIRAAKATDALVGRGDQPIASAQALTAPAAAQEAPRPLPPPGAASSTANASPASTSPPTSSASAEQPTRRRRRAAEPTPPLAGAQEPATAPFRPQAQPAPEQAPNGPAATFGVASPSPMTTELNQQLDSFFGKP